MANWVANKITAKGIKDLDIFDEKGIIDFNKIIPEPTERSYCPEEFRIDLHPDSTVLPNENRPWFNWLRWRNKFWGVKANADEHDSAEVSEQDTIWFDTAWYTPYPIIATVSEMLGNVELELIWKDIDNCFAPIYRYIWENGRMIRAYASNVDINLEGYNWYELKIPNDFRYRS